MDQYRKSVDREEDRRPISDGPEQHEPPRLVELGSFDQLTQGTHFGHVDMIETTS